MNILFLSAWYPNRTDKMIGLFVRKHAEAVSVHANVWVIYVQADPSVKQIEKEEIISNSLTEIIYYIPASHKTLTSKIKKQYCYLRSYYLGYRHLKKNDFNPDIIHVNILTRTGVMGYIYSKLLKIPYVITEHWTRYTKENNSYKGVLRKMLTGLVVKNASAVFPVSENLKKSMINFKLNNKNYRVINNTIDDCFLEHKTIEKRDFIRMVHISCFDDKAKNISGILRVVKKISAKRDNFELTLIGTGIDYKKMIDYANELNIASRHIAFIGEKMPDEVSYWVQNSDFSILFSNYENSPVVISESLVCGKPVVSTNVGGISELIDNTNGILITAKDEQALADSIEYMLDNYQNYNSELIKKDAIAKFSYESIGNKLIEEYKSCINK
jgi:glycosyltransferase involved in cell wall biosynthesis